MSVATTDTAPEATAQPAAKPTAKPAAQPPAAGPANAAGAKPAMRIDLAAAQAAVAARPHSPLAALLKDREAFSPALVEVAEGAPLPALLWLPAVAFVILAVLVLWSALARIDIVATATGRLVPSGRVKVVQAADTGVVRRILVHNGEVVQAGQVLIELDPTEAEADQTTLAHKLMAARLEMAALEAALAAGAERDPVTLFQAPPGTPPEAAALRRRVLQGDWLDFRAQIGAAEGEVARSRAALAGSEAGLAKLRAIQPILTERVTTKKYLVSHALAARPELLELQQALVENQQEQSVMQHTLAQNRAEVTLAEQRGRQLWADHAKDLLGKLSESTETAAALAGELRKADERTERRTLRAPSDGIVTDLALHTVGAVAREADVLMKIVPEDQPLEVEAMVLNRDVGFVHRGDRVNVKVESFPYTRYGTIEGSVLDVAADSGSEQGPAGPTPPVAARAEQSTYRARVTLSRSTIQVDGRAVRLSPGMSVTVNIRTGERSVLDYILAPVLRYEAEGMRER